MGGGRTSENQRSHRDRYTSRTALWLVQGMDLVEDEVRAVRCPSAEPMEPQPDHDTTDGQQPEQPAVAGPRPCRPVEAVQESGRADPGERPDDGPEQDPAEGHHGWAIGGIGRRS